MQSLIYAVSLNIESREQQNKTTHLSIKNIFKSPFIKDYNYNVKFKNIETLL